MVDDPQGRFKTKIVAPSNLKFSNEEHELIVKSFKIKDAGFMPRWFEFVIKWPDTEYPWTLQHIIR